MADDRRVALDDSRVSFEDRRTVRLTGRLAVAVVGWVGVAALVAFDASLASNDPLVPAGVPLLGGWQPTRLDWLTLVAAVGWLAVALPVLRPARLRAGWAAYPSGIVPRLALGVLCLTAAVGVVGPAVVAEPTEDLQGTDQPPVGFTVATPVAGDCVGSVSDGRCHGSLTHPLGTTRGGADVLAWIVYGARTTVQFVLVTAALLAPLGVVVGAVGGYAGGRLDALLTSYVDLQQTVPTVVIYVLVTALVGPTLFALILVYGLFDWGSVARVVRSRTLDEREESYVEAAESAGAGRLYTLRHHLLPNVASTALTGVSLALPKLVLIEIGLSFVSLGGEGTRSWGQLLQRGLRFELGSLGGGYALSGNVRALWWVPIVPAVATLLVVLAASLVGDAVQSASDPTGD